MAQIAVTSTLTKSLHTLKKENEKSLTMYVCGVTPYDDAHIGHGRCYVTFDVLYRLLRAVGHEVVYCRNITDIDDKLLNRARTEEGDEQLYHRIAERYTARFQEDMVRLGCVKPTHEPRVTDHIPQIIAAVERLVASGHAYVANGSVYFRIDTYAPYGTLSGQDMDALCAGARVEVNEEKENSLDFALWKAEADGTYWKSPWGYGRPGWHIECSALALRYCGETIDIHGGGMDLIFPHHENERAQSECMTQKPFVRVWMHNAFVRVHAEKMSKSLGNFVTLRDAYQRVEPMVLRYYYLIHHYRNPLDFSWDDLAVARKSYRKLTQLLATVVQPGAQVGALPDGKSLSPEVAQFAERLLAFICDDINIQGAFGFIFEHVQQIKQNEAYARYVAALLQNVLGLTLEPLVDSEVVITPEIQKLIDERVEARARRDWKRADELRAQLQALGVVVQDEKL